MGDCIWRAIALPDLSVRDEKKHRSGSAGMMSSLILE